MSGVNASPLGKSSDYVDHYDAGLLFGIARSEARQALGIADDLPFVGVDVWNAYELSWLNRKGKPQVALAVLEVPCHSPQLVESKSLKLYLNSFANTVFDHDQAVVDTIQADMSATAGAQVSVHLSAVDGEFAGLPDGAVCLDALDIAVDRYEVDASLLTLVDQGKTVSETLYSHLLRSRCPVTGQPDWATLVVRYEGAPIAHEGLLRYLIGYRNHQGFHEQLVEQIYCDIKRQCQPDKLTVYGRFTRRGGIDINPWRSSHMARAENWRTVRQ